LKTRVPATSDLARGLAKQYGYEEWLVSRFLEYVPHPQEFLEKMDRAPTQYIRVNTLKTSAKQVKERLSAKGFMIRETILPEVLSVSAAPISVGATTEYLLGLYYVQDLSSCIALDALDVAPGMSVLDIGAAPGGKTTMAAQRMANSGLIIALEPNPKRARSMSFNVARCGVSNVCILDYDGQEVSRLGMKFDRVLLDAPCSCEGVIAKDATRKTSHEPSDVEFCSSRQEQLIQAAAEAVRPGGILVYSTCSFAPEENEAVVSHLLRKRSDVSVEPIQHGVGGMERFLDISFESGMKDTRRLYPHLHDTTGFFIAKLRFTDN
jgi:NOL1/NOP2/sun family putative RNA methylase